MSGVWKRSQGRPSEAPPDERGGKQIWSTYSHRATPRLYTYANIDPGEPGSGPRSRPGIGPPTWHVALGPKRTQAPMDY